ncbi:MAG: Rpn family recombination-promoting nuclease/putative transposase [Calothrix sp. FI2-JRJ7]|nr:Rpn family recombination-promoting nuclease/putative transposase [Calothrix sp. FI2-JRJ7]
MPVLLKGADFKLFIINISKARQELSNKAAQETFLELIESIVINKYPKLSREEVQEMLTLNLIRGTRYYQELKEELKEELEEEITAKVKAKVEKKAKAEAKEEVKLDTAARLLQRGISPQEVAAALELDLETVNNIASTQL